MNESEWLSSDDPTAMLDWLLGSDQPREPSPTHVPSERKLRLYACAVALHGCGGQAWRNVQAAYAGLERGHGHRIMGAHPPALIRQELRLALHSRPADRTPLAGLLRDIMGNPFRAVPPLTRTVPCDRCNGKGERTLGRTCGVCDGEGVIPGSADWLTPMAAGIARRVYDERDWGALPVLADALEEAGCEDAQILDHVRCPGPHVRGCWVIDVLLGKS